MDPFWPPHTLSLRGCNGSRTGDVPPAQCRFVRHGGRYGHDFRPNGTHVPRHEHQHGHATLQDAGWRHGERETKGTGLLHTEFPLQCRFGGGLYLPLLLHLYRHQQHCPRRCRPRLGYLVLLRGRSHTYPLRYLHHIEG